MKAEIYLFFLSGRFTRGLVHTTGNVPTRFDTAVSDLVGMLQGVGLPANRDTLRVKLRRFAADSIWEDGVLADGFGNVAYIQYFPAGTSIIEVSRFLGQSVRANALLAAVNARDWDAVITEATLPVFPEMDFSQSVIWEREQVYATAHGR